MSNFRRIPTDQLLVDRQDDCTLLIRFKFWLMEQGNQVAVRIRMKPMGRTHRHFYRIVVIDSRQPNDGRVIEDLGTYDPHVRDGEKGVTLIPDRIKYWKSVGAKVSDKVEILINKYIGKFEAAQAAEPKPA